MNENKSAKDRAKEKMFDALLEYAAASHVERIIEENKISEEDLDFTPSPELDKKMKKLIARHERHEKIKNFKKATLSFLPKAAIFLLVIVGSLTLAIASVDALRVKAFNLIVDMQDQYTGFRMQENTSGQIDPAHEQIPADWSGYIPGYVAEGFEVLDAEQDAVSYIIYYINNNGQTIRFNQILNLHTDLRIDTENAKLEQIMIHDNEALLVEKQGLVSIVWQDEYLFYIIGEADKAELVQMAKSLQRI